MTVGIIKVNYIKDLTFAAGLMISLVRPIVFFPLCLQTYPIKSLWSCVGYVAIITSALIWPSHSTLFSSLLTFMLLVGGSSGHFYVDHVILLFGSTMATMHQYILIPWSIYVFALKAHYNNSSTKHVKYF